MYGLTRKLSFSDITNSTEVVNILSSLYASVDDLDPYVGGLAEDHTGIAHVGPLFAAAIKKHFLNARDGDRFWFENNG